MKKILILGANGYIGYSLGYELAKDKHYELYGTYHTAPVMLPGMHTFRLDAGSIREAIQAIEKVKPDSIITCLINRGSDFNQQFAFDRSLALYSQKTGCGICFCSTANTVIKKRSGPYYEDCRPDPDCDYGRYKAQCEAMYLEQIPQNICIMRLPQIWGKRSRHFTGLLSTVKSGKKITLYPNLFLNFNTDAALARQIHFLLDQRFSGVIHLAATDTVNYKEFVLRILSGLGYGTPRYEENPDVNGNIALYSRKAAGLPEEFNLSNHDVIEYVIKGELEKEHSLK